MPRCVFVAARHSRNHFLAALLSRHGFHSDAPHETAFLSWIPRTPFRGYFPSPSRSFTGWISAEPRRKRRSRISAADNFRGTDCSLAPTHPVCSPADPRVQPQRPAICRAPLRPPGVLALASPPPAPPRTPERPTSSQAARSLAAAPAAGSRAGAGARGQRSPHGARPAGGWGRAARGKGIGSLWGHPAEAEGGSGGWGSRQRRGPRGTPADEGWVPDASLRPPQPAAGRETAGTGTAGLRADSAPARFPPFPLRPMSFQRRLPPLTAAAGDQ